MVVLSNYQKFSYFMFCHVRNITNYGALCLLQMVVLTECTRYIQYLLVVAWLYGKGDKRSDEDILQSISLI